MCAECNKADVKSQRTVKYDAPYTLIHGECKSLVISHIVVFIRIEFHLDGFLSLISQFVSIERNQLLYASDRKVNYCNPLQHV
jgi:hypothetical protein